MAGKSGSRRGPNPHDWSLLANADLVGHCCAGEPAAWREFVARFSGLVYATIRRYRLGDEDARDAFQATMASAHRQIERLAAPERVVSWLISIASRNAIDQLRARTRETLVSDWTDELAGRPARGSRPAPLADEALAELEASHYLHRALQDVPPRCRRLFDALYFEDPAPSYREIGRRERIAVGTIGPLRARCLDDLQRALTQRGWRE